MDRLPEDQHWADTGCAVQPSCLHCPLPRCVYDVTPEERLAGLQARDRAIYEHHRAMRDPIHTAELAREFGVSRRTVYRAIRRAEALMGEECDA